MPGGPYSQCPQNRKRRKICPSVFNRWAPHTSSFENDLSNV